ncbi:hypothetical protein A2866_06285 [Candidatus Roizmanbacteria bacterium RIFCSPHIGHO2_01_FULL_39_8]|uniref:Antitoxin n=3 Tax=Candidatus Roizmaniibacteriota TaxID=1752723 RepID=A0A1F7GMI2_9BACT|nr:MAG: hypothetical protein A2866_06285 [Candidatus Roizmanbacteria bacterium RIFCSPHIGHO2_01_FULL_39_8]OGK25961.1 MAG: hypothetical protein A3C28_06455 [Candidatus Roizmanbacteria bacterium RIFCSPHIGHO2_02_FULL_39_9]OGK34788.1 MAG: hypothetical protein A3F60_05040 [Candidatus Roizmanbacteria bacterium RIFCSPHIGHO2_12_FULL_39_8]
MKYFDLSNEEKKILDEFERGEWVEIKETKQEKRHFQRYASNTLNKLKNINIRLSLRDLQRIRAQALESGLPYQTLLSALIHQYAEKKIKLEL